MKQTWVDSGQHWSTSRPTICQTKKPPMWVGYCEGVWGSALQAHGMSLCLNYHSPDSTWLWLFPGCFGWIWQAASDNFSTKDFAQSCFVFLFRQISALGSLNGQSPHFAWNLICMDVNQVSQLLLSWRAKYPCSHLDTDLKVIHQDHGSAPAFMQTFIHSSVYLRMIYWEPALEEQSSIHEYNKDVQWAVGIQNDVGLEMPLR